MKLAPVMFVGHGSPMFAIEASLARELLQQQQPEFSGVQAIVVVSAHWVTDGYTGVTYDEAPQTIHDFGGFPAALYQLSYPASGQPSLAKAIEQQLLQSGYQAQLQSQRGLDHGAWVPLLHLVPKADIPVIQVSLNRYSSEEDVYRLGQTLSQLREQGVAVIGSGSLTHNLRDVIPGSQQAADYVVKLEQWIREQIVNRDVQALLKVATLQEDFARAHPTHEHYLPLLMALGASQPRDQLTILKGGVQHHALSMESYVWH
ncbi:DODA-type extradiol aromatic ring-opening family dioxygenase [Vibrio aphrogenes]|uniref:DODA-type extradiol aromatic ring-opening family dioxygenase n=1 Tax=Vibrio aphrogenes TaxID=1891186 RepID=UPI000B359A22|nr:class III extradiol ring-cleavage dioxygenase [Vibrio aphrogenes]